MIKAFFDSDVVISAHLSNSGAAMYLLRVIDLKNISTTFYISNESLKEIKRTCERLSVKYNEKITQRCVIENIKPPYTYKKYVKDALDEHIVVATVATASKFLVTYNQKHFNNHLLYNDFGIKVVTPGMFLQYLKLKLSQLTKNGS